MCSRGCTGKKEATPLSPKGSRALAVLKVAELNGQWQSFWYPDEKDYQAAAWSRNNLKPHVLGDIKAYEDPILRSSCNGTSARGVRPAVSV